MSAASKPQASNPLAGGRFLPALLLLFVGSGCAALIYEIVWLQLLQLLIGSTAVSLGVLLATFMGGMCLGSLLLPRYISAAQHPLRVYAFLELGIGVLGLLIWWGFGGIEAFYTNFGHGSSGIFLRAVVSAICLLPPTILMGATLPAIARWVETTPRGVSWLGLFYGGNIVGAVAGCLLAGFYLLRVYDMGVATLAAVAINVAVALCAIGLASLTPRSAPAVAPAAGRMSIEGAKSIYLTIAISGFCALGAEVVWTRTLSLLLGGTVYTFSIILAVFLIGLGIGSNIGALLSRGSMSPRVALGVCQMLLVGAIAWTAYMVSSSLPYWPIDPGRSVQNDPKFGPWLMFQVDIVRTMWAILPAAALWGASFPLALAAAARPGQDPGRLVGGVYATNTVGAILGAIGFSLFFVPEITTRGAQQLLIIMSMGAALIALAPVLLSALQPKPTSGESAPLGLTMAVALAVVAAGWLAFNVRPIPWGMVAYGRHMAGCLDSLDLRQIYDNPKDVPYDDPKHNIFCLFTREGMNVSVAVTETSRGTRNFHGAGKVQAATEPQDMRLQRMLGHLSALAVKKPENVLVVACGAGVTAGSFVVHPDVKKITICDIEPVVPKFVTPYFSEFNYGITDGMVDRQEKKIGDKKVKLVFDDGRHFVRTTDEKYDVITSDPIDPWVKGCAALNTVEYYKMCKDKLNDGGVMTLWIPLYESNEDTFKSILTTFFEVFPNGILWSNDYQAQGYDAVLFGIKVPEGQDPAKYEIDLDAYEARLAREDHAPVMQSLRDVGFTSATDLLATYAGRAAELKAGGWTDAALINHDRNLRLQYLAGMWFNSHLGTEILGSVLKHYRYPRDLFISDNPTLHAALEASLISGGRFERTDTPKQSQVKPQAKSEMSLDGVHQDP